MATSPTPAEAPPSLAEHAARWRWVLVALVLVVLGFFGFWLWRELQQEEVAGRWDDLQRLQDRYESPQDPLFEDPGGFYRQRRDLYLEELETFLAGPARAEDDALAPHVHWLIAKICTDQILSMKDVLDPAKRAPYYEKALAHLQALQTEYPDFPINWTTLAPPEKASITRLFVDSLTANQAWEQENLPRSIAPGTDVVVVIRTERGDLRMGLYPEQAPEMVALFLQHALRGDYDGTAFFARQDAGSDADPVERSIRGGLPASRGVAAYDKTGALGMTEIESAEAILPASSRAEILVEPGVVLAWHEPSDVYDGAQQILVAIGRSPRLDYRYSPIGRLLDEESRATARRIFDSKLWRADPTVADDTGDLRGIAGFFQAPVGIVKVLVYRDGRLVQPEEGPGPNKATVETSEQELASLEKDQYRTEAPAPPAPPAPPPSDEGAGDGATNGAANDGGEGAGTDGPGTDGSTDDGATPPGDG